MIAELLSATGFASALFAGLAASPEVAARQKSAVVQALRSVFPAPSAFVEEDSRWDFSTEPEDIHYRIQLRCLKCPQPVETVDIEPESVRYSSVTDRQEAFHLQFRAKSSGDGSSWTVLGQIEKLPFAVAAKRSLAPGAAASSEDFETIACGARKSCRGGTTFDTHSEASEFMSTLRGLVARRSVSAGKVLTKGDFSSPIAIRKGAEVYLSMTADSGLSIRARALAMESGAAGDRIRVKLQSGTWDRDQGQTQTLIGRITSPDEVLYEK